MKIPRGNHQQLIGSCFGNYICGVIIHAFKSYRFFFPLVFLQGAVLLSLVGCSEISLWGSQSECKIVYDITYPSAQSSLVAKQLYPQEMVVYYKGDKMKTEISSPLGLMATELFINHEDRTLSQTLKNISSYQCIKLSPEETENWCKLLPQYEIKQRIDLRRICNKECRHATIKDLSNSKEFEVFYMEESGLAENNWWNPMNKITGVMMSYDIEQMGMHMHLEAREIIHEKIPDEIFTVKPEYKEISADSMRAILEKLVRDYGPAQAR